LEGPTALTEAFVASLPAGIGPDRAREYLRALEVAVLKATSITEGGRLARDRYLRGTNRILLNHPSMPEFVSVSARQTLIDALELPRDRVSQHSGDCDDFFIYTCTLGDNPAWVESAREQMLIFVQSGGVSVSRPAR